MTIPFTTYYHHGLFYWKVTPDDIFQYTETFYQEWKVGDDAKYKQRQYLERHAERILPELGEYVLDLFDERKKAKGIVKQAV
jgi:hypothetical protein